MILTLALSCLGIGLAVCGLAWCVRLRGMIDALEDAFDPARYAEQVIKAVERRTRDWAREECQRFSRQAKLGTRSVRPEFYAEDDDLPHKPKTLEERMQALAGAAGDIEIVDNGDIVPPKGA